MCELPLEVSCGCDPPGRWKEDAVVHLGPWSSPIEDHEHQSCGGSSPTQTRPERLSWRVCVDEEDFSALSSMINISSDNIVRTIYILVHHHLLSLSLIIFLKKFLRKIRGDGGHQVPSVRAAGTV